MSLRLRLAVLFAIATALAFGLFAVLFAHVVDHSLDTAVDASLTERAPFVERFLASAPYAHPTGTPAGVIRPFPFRHAGGDRDAFGPPAVQLLGPKGTVLRSFGLAERTSLLSPADLARAEHGRVYLTAEVPGSSESMRVLAEPASPTSSTPKGSVLVLGLPLGTGPAAEERVLTFLLWAIAPAAVLAGLAAWLLARAALRPVERMRTAAAELSEHDGATGLPVPDRRDEIAALGRTFNDLLSRLHAALARQRAFVADASHELRTPLAVLKVELELAQHPSQTFDQLRESVSYADQEVSRLAKLAEDLLLLAQADEHHLRLDPEPTDLAALAAAAADAARRRGEVTGVAVQVRPDGPGPFGAVADRQRLRQALDNLLDNALRFAPPGSTVTVTLANRTGADGRAWTRLSVADGGPGFPPEFLPVAFDRFRRAEAGRARSSGGAGLGLAIVRSIALAHGGDAGAANREPGGAVVWVDLPVAGVEEPTEDPQPTGVPQVSR